MRCELRQVFDHLASRFAVHYQTISYEHGDYHNSTVRKIQNIIITEEDYQGLDFITYGNIMIINRYFIEERVYFSVRLFFYRIIDNLEGEMGF